MYSSGVFVIINNFLFTLTNTPAFLRYRINYGRKKFYDTGSWFHNVWSKNTWLVDILANKLAYFWVIEILLKDRLKMIAREE